jgi:7TM diverse intracellular signalling/7TMR-DISM extracellular 2
LACNRIAMHRTVQLWGYRLLLVLVFFQTCLTLPVWSNTTSVSTADGHGAVNAWAWTPTVDGDNFETARLSLQQTRLALYKPGTAQFGFQLQAHQTRWYALELTSDSAQSMSLELTHPSIRSADLYLPQDEALPIVIRSGRYIPAQMRPETRFPSTLQLPAHIGTRTVYLRLSTIVPVRGQFIYQPESQWTAQSLMLRQALVAYFCIALLAAIYAIFRAVLLHSKAYALYAGLTLSIALTAMFISGYGESWLWPFLAPWRGELSSAMACVSTGLVLLLAQRAFTLQVQAPALSRWLLILGWLCPLLGIGGAAFDLAVQKTLSEVSVGIAIVMGLCSFWFAWHTTNRPAMWFLIGYTPVIIGATTTTLAFAGLIAFMPWVLLSLPLACVLEVPFNLYALSLLEKRHAQVRQSLTAMTRDNGAPGESRQAIQHRLSMPPMGTGTAKKTSFAFMLLRFEALAPGSAAVGQLDGVALERYFHSVMAAALQSSNLVGRWSFNELVVRYEIDSSSTAQTDSLISALFSQALRGEPFGIRSHDSSLRIAYAYLSSDHTSPETIFKRFSDALDDPSKIGKRRIKLSLPSG